MPPKVRGRAVKAINKLVKVPLHKEPKEDQKPGLFSKCKCKCKCPSLKKKDEIVEESATELTPELSKANNEGLEMIKSIALPALPALLQDAWVLLELAISISAFIVGAIGLFPIEQNRGVNLASFAVNILCLILALIDGYMYLFELGTCATAFYYLRTKHTDKKVEDENIDDDEARLNQTKLCLALAIKQKISSFYEVGRTVFTELVLFPLLMLDLLTFIVERGYDTESAQDRADFAFFIIGCFYTILGVYIMRVFVLTGSTVSLNNLPINPNAGAFDISLIKKFCLHSIGQVVVHFMIVIVIGVKINNEHSMNSTASDENSTASDDKTIRGSRFLYLSMVLGYLLPLAGTGAFFIVNYYWMREFSIGFWINMISLLQGADFASTVFGGEGLSEVKEQVSHLTSETNEESMSETSKQERKEEPIDTNLQDQTLQFVEQSDYLKVRKQLKKLKSPPWWAKFFYPARVPFVALYGIIYDVVLAAFIASLMLTYDNGVQLAILQNDDAMSSVFFVAVIIIMLANIHIIVLFNSLLLVLLVVVTVTLLAILLIILPLFLFLYFPLVGILGYCGAVKLVCCSRRQKRPVDPELDGSRTDLIDLKVMS